MPIDPTKLRREIHHRTIDMRAYVREDSLYDVEARLVDTKPYAFLRFSSAERWPANQPVHDMRIRLAVDDHCVVREIQASSDTTPFGICKEAEGTLSVLIGERIARGWSSRVKELLRGAASCTHLMEMLIPARRHQGIGALRNEAGVDLEASMKPRDPRIRQTCAWLKRTPCMRSMTAPTRLIVHSSVLNPCSLGPCKSAARTLANCAWSSCAGRPRSGTARKASMPPASSNAFHVYTVWRATPTASATSAQPLPYCSIRPARNRFFAASRNPLLHHADILQEQA